MRDGLDELKARQEAARRARAAAEQNTDASAHLDASAIAACRLCDDDSYRGNRICHHIDYAATAKRGLALIRKTMSWNRDETRDETPPPPPTPSPTPKNPPKRNTAPTTGHQTHTHHPKNPPT